MDRLWICYIFFLLFVLPFSLFAEQTKVEVEQVEVSVIKQGRNLQNEAVSATTYGASQIAKDGISGLKNISDLAPNFFMPNYGSRTTSSIYVRGLGARIDNPVIGLTVDNVPILNKDNYDLEMVDIDRIELIRGPQSALYGRNTMGGVINLYTFSPLKYQGVRASVEYGSGNSMKVNSGVYLKNSKGNWGAGVVAFYNRSDGLFTNDYNGEKLDNEKYGGGRFRLQHRSKSGFTLDNTASFSILNQGGYPYKLAGAKNPSYNDPSSFDRTNFTNGLTMSQLFDKFSLSSITSFQYTDNLLVLDNDFTPHNYFILNQAVNEHTLTQDFIIKSHNSRSHYDWLVGAFGFWQGKNLDAPVLFKDYGIEQLIVSNASTYDPEYKYLWDSDSLLLNSSFHTPTVGGALYHKSTVLVDRWKFDLGLRLDYEHLSLDYKNYTETSFKAINKKDESLVYPSEVTINNGDYLWQHFFEFLPRFDIQYSLGERGFLYGSVAKGYKSGGFNTQMFSDVLQQQLMKEISGMGTAYDVEQIITYSPEHSWNYEIGAKISCNEARVWTTFALFYIDCTDQQLTRFPEGTTTGRMMTNAGKTRSFGGEFSIRSALTSSLNLYCDYGYTNATFVDYNNGKEQFAGNKVPYSPSHTLSVRGDYTIDINSRALDAITIYGSANGAGKIYWNEQNSLSQPFYCLFEGRLSLKKEQYILTLWGKNLGNSSYNTFYFESIGNQFVQSGQPRTFGATLSVNFKL